MKCICYDNDVSISVLCVMCVSACEWLCDGRPFQNFSVFRDVEGSYRRGKATKAVVVGVPYRFPSASVHKPPRRSFLR